MASDLHPSLTCVRANVHTYTHAYLYCHKMLPRAFVLKSRVDDVGDGAVMDPNINRGLRKPERYLAYLLSTANHAVVEMSSQMV